MSKRSKRTTRHTEDEAFAELEATVHALGGRISAATSEIGAALPALLESAIAKAVEQAVAPYRAAEAMRQKELLVQEHLGWGNADANRHSGVLT